MDVITAPLVVRPIGIAGGFRRFGGAGGGRRGGLDIGISDMGLGAERGGVGGSPCCEGYDVSEESVRLLFFWALPGTVFDVVSAGRLGTLELLGRRIWSKGERSVGLGMSKRAPVKISTLLLCLNDLVDPMFPIGIDIMVAGGLSEDDASLIGLKGRFTESFRNSTNCTHQSPDKHRSTRRLVVGETSRMLVLLSIDSSIDRI